MPIIDLSSTSKARQSFLNVIGRTEKNVLVHELYRTSLALPIISLQSRRNINYLITSYHYSTLNKSYPNSFYRDGVQNLYSVLENKRSALSMFLNSFGIFISPSLKTIYFKDKIYDIDKESSLEHYGQAEYAWLHLSVRLNRDFGVNAFLTKNHREYSVINNGPEILYDLDNALCLSGELFSSWAREAIPVIIEADIPISKLKPENDWHWLINEMVKRGFPESAEYDPNFANEYTDEDILYLRNDTKIEVSEIKSINSLR